MVENSARAGTCMNAQYCPCVCMAHPYTANIINLLPAQRRMVEIFIENERRTLTIEHTGALRELLSRVGVLPETVLIVRDGDLVTEEDDVGDARRVELLSVISGG